MKIFNYKKFNESVTEKEKEFIKSEEFINFFGDWKDVNVESSKIVDIFGYPKLVYHQTTKEYKEEILKKGFQKGKEKASKFDFETPYGYFFKSSDKDIGLEGKEQIKGYLNIRNPIFFRNREDVRYKVSKMNPKYSKLIKEIDLIDEEYGKKIDELIKGKRKLFLEDKKKFEENKKVIEKVFDEWKIKYDKKSLEAKKELDSTIKGLNHDGFILFEDVGGFGRKTDTYIIFDKEQFKIKK